MSFKIKSVFSFLFFTRLIFLLIIPIHLYANESQVEFENWLQKQYEVSTIKMFANFNRPGTLKGTIIASPSQINPDYYYHWVRDASVAIGNVFLMLNIEKVESVKIKYKEYLNDFIEVTKVHQNQVSTVGLGEVRFFPNGLPYLAPWARPQNDGPAIRALVLSYYARFLLNNGEEDFVRKNLYNGEWPARTVIKRDLEYISNNWENPSYDMWEEVYGDHFFNRFIQAQALKFGALLAEKMNDPGAANWYRMQSLKILNSLFLFWNPRTMQIDATIHFTDNRNKISNLDSTVILAIMALDCGNNHNFGISDERTINTVWKLIQTFKNLYLINKKYPDLAPAMGRYSEDTYDGYQNFSMGNPWFLTTAAMASYTYRLAWALKRDGGVAITALNFSFFRDIVRDNPKLLQELGEGQFFSNQTWQFNQLFQSLFKAGDLYLKRIRFHMGSDGSMSEQFNRDNGFMQGASDLTMSYTAFIRAVLSRRNLLPF